MDIGETLSALQNEATLSTEAHCKFVVQQLGAEAAAEMFIGRITAYRDALVGLMGGDAAYGIMMDLTMETDETKQKIAQEVGEAATGTSQ